MSALLVSLIAVILLIAGYIVYGRYIEQLFTIDPGRRTPAHEQYDGVDYIPARHWTILFGHHFSSIAGAGPILGPVLAAAVWGWLPALLWIIIGTIFIGAVHDFASLAASMRHQGRSISDVAEKLIGMRAKLLFAAFIWLALILVVAVFAAATANTLINEPRIVIPTFGLILVAVLVGLMIYRWKVSQAAATVVGIGLLGLLMYIGYINPVVLGSPASIKIWIVILLIYAYIASILPVNIILQPRDYLSTFVLFIGLILGYIGLFLSRPVMHTPAVVAFNGTKGPMFPMLFVFIACGAISGFHSLISSGTTAKQLDNERDARRIGYGAMVLEGVLAVLALIAVTAGLYWNKAEAAGIDAGLVYPELLKTGNWIGTFAAGYGQIVKPLVGTLFGSMLAIITLNAFVMTTLDSATRITRYITEEFFADGLKLSLFRNRYLSTLLVVAASLSLALGNWQKIWPVFGASNQLVAALTLMVVSIWLLKQGRRIIATTIPMVFMFIITISALIYQITMFLKAGNYLLSGIAALLIILAVLVVVDSIPVFLRRQDGGK